MYKISLRRRVRSDKKGRKKSSHTCRYNTSKSICARKKVCYSGVEEGDARANAYQYIVVPVRLWVYLAYVRSEESVPYSPHPVLKRCMHV